jgi:hypothetical protein
MGLDLKILLNLPLGELEFFKMNKSFGQKNNLQKTVLWYLRELYIRCNTIIVTKKIITA